MQFWAYFTQRFIKLISRFFLQISNLNGWEIYTCISAYIWADWSYCICCLPTAYWYKNECIYVWHARTQTETLIRLIFSPQTWCLQAHTCIFFSTCAYTQHVWTHSRSYSVTSYVTKFGSVSVCVREHIKQTWRHIHKHYAY